MQLNQHTRAMGLSLLLAGGVCLTACSDDTPSGADSGVTVKDATTGPNPDATTGPNPDATTGPNPDATTGPGPDGGRMDGGGGGDGGRDGGMMGNCMAGTEGCPCTAMMGCDGNLSCVTWPFDDTDPMAVPVRTCVASCDDDMGCMGNTLGNTACRAFFFQTITPTTAPGGICSQPTANAGEACRGSRRPGGMNNITGCSSEDEFCLTNQGPGEAQADEGVCAQLCRVTTSTPTGGCAAPTPYCNPDASGLAGTSTSGMQFGWGVCSVERIPVGALCKQDDITRGCDQADTAEGVLCVGLPETEAMVTGNGVCVEFCRLSTGICQLGQTCVTAISSTTFGVCSAECEQSPDSCDRAGHAGAGQTCFGEYTFQGGTAPVTICADNQLPALEEVRIQIDMGQPTVIAGEPCDAMPGDAMRCPDGTACVEFAQGQTGCLRGCTTSTASPHMRGGCELNSNTSSVSTCVDLNDMDMLPLGLCVEPL